MPDYYDFTCHNCNNIFEMLMFYPNADVCLAVCPKCGIPTETKKLSKTRKVRNDEPRNLEDED